MSIFNETIIHLNKKVSLNLINIENYSVELFSLINDEIAKIWDGDLDDNDFETVKLEFNSWLCKKNLPKNMDSSLSLFVTYI